MLGSEEFINGTQRWCLWLKDASASEIAAIRPIKDRVGLVKKQRQNSERPETKKLAATPALFGEIRQPTARYLAFPEVSSERRVYIPTGFLDSEVVATNKLYTIGGASVFHFGVLSSAMHMAWTRTVCGRIEERLSIFNRHCL